MRRVLWGGAGLVGLLALASGGARLWVARTVAPLAGRESVAGLGDSVTVLWDSLAVPHVSARSEDDLFAAIGYLHARDRMWEMDLLRHAAEGRLSELFGARTVATDRSLRVLELPRIARTVEGSLGPRSRRALEAYARGVNTWLARDNRALEFRILGHTPEPWRPEHSIVIARLEAWDLRTTGAARALARVAGRLGADTAALLAPTYPDSAPTIMPRGLWRGARPGPRAAPSSAGVGRSRAPASNAWVLGPSHTASHKPILANDPHLTLRAPSIWYLVGAHAPGYEVVGGTIPGLPLVILGHTRQLAWGFTNAMVEDVEYFVEALSRDSAKYRTASGWADVEVVPETIWVRGAAPVIYRRRRTADGPLVERAADDSGPPLAMRWVAQDASDEFAALLAMGRATDLPSFTTAVAGFRSPEQNVVYADAAGNIAYFLAGHVPLRRGGGGDGAPRPGWTAFGKWERYLTAAELPHVVNPPEGFIVTANNRVSGPEYPFFISDAWELPYRAQRIREMVWRDSVATVRSVARDQLDVVDVFCRALAPHVARAARAAGRAELADRLSAWDGSMSTDRFEPTLVWSWYRELERLAYAGVSPAYRRAEPLHRWLAEGKSPWHDLPALERGALEHVLPHVAGMPWGAAHHTIERHPLGDVGVLQLLVGFDIGPLPTPGGNYTVNVASSDAGAAPFESAWGPSLRHVVDLADVDGGGGFILPAGQSGHPFSPHYRDQTDRWLRGALWLLPLDLRKVGVLARLVLVPERR